MAAVIGVALAIAFGVFASVVRLDRDRAFYPTVMIVIALLYALYAMIGDSTQALLSELPGIVLFVAAAVIGFKRSLWVVAAALVGHGIYDFAHPHLFINPGVPPWWPAFCAGYDIAAGAFLALLIWKRKAAGAGSGETISLGA